MRCPYSTLKNRPVGASLLANPTASSEVPTVGTVRTNREQARSYRHNRAPVNNYYETGRFSRQRLSTENGSMTATSSPPVLVTVQEGSSQVFNHYGTEGSVLKALLYGYQLKAGQL